MRRELAIVTGEARGIGRAPGERLARRDARLAVVDLNVAAAQPFAEEFRAADGQASAGAAAGIPLDPGAA